MRNEQEAGNCGYSTAETHSDRFSQFASWAKENGVNRMEKVDQELVQRYGQELAASDKSPAYAQNCVSSVNTVMSAATGGKWESVSPTKDCGIEARSHVREEAPASIDREAAARMVAAASGVSERCGAMAEVAHQFGLRSEEAAKMDAQKALSDAQERGAWTVENGTKGGQAREAEVRSDSQMAALERAAAAQEHGRSLIPSDQSYAQFREGDMREAREAMQAEGGGWHDLRAGYACERYESLTGHAAPCVEGEREAERDEDRSAREQISEELGHHRIDVTASYLGSSR